jgi:hypothetical protein
MHCVHGMSSHLGRPARIGKKNWPRTLSTQEMLLKSDWNCIPTSSPRSGSTSCWNCTGKSRVQSQTQEQVDLDSSLARLMVQLEEYRLYNTWWRSVGSFPSHTETGWILGAREFLSPLTDGLVLFSEDTNFRTSRRWRITEHTTCLRTEIFSGEYCSEVHGNHTTNF